MIFNIIIDDNQEDGGFKSKVTYNNKTIVECSSDTKFNTLKETLDVMSDLVELWVDDGLDLENL